MRRRREESQVDASQDPEEPVEPGALIAFVRWLKGWRQNRLAREARMDPSRISRYESGDAIPQSESMDRILKAGGLRFPLVAAIKSFIRLIRQALVSAQGVAPRLPVPNRTQEGVQRAVWGLVERAIALLQLELGILWSLRPAEGPAPQSAADLTRVEDLLDRLKRSKSSRRQILIEESPAFQDWLLCDRLCEESIRAGAQSAQEVLEWALLAVEVARRVPGSEAWRNWLRGYAEATLGSAFRVGNRYEEAKDAFSRGRRYRKEGRNEAGLLDPGRPIDLEASFYRDQRCFGEAIKLHDQALRVARPDQRGMILLNKAYTLEEKGDYEASIEVLQQASHEVDGQRQPRLLFGVRFNFAGNLVRLSRAQEAMPIIAEVRELAERLQNDLDLVRTRWLEGNALAGLGRRDEAIAALEEVRHNLRKLPFDYALASLDLAQVYLKEGRLGEVQELAVEMLGIFEALKVQREAIAAFLLFRDASAQGAVTEDLVRRLQEYLKKVRVNPKLRFEAT